MVNWAGIIGLCAAAAGILFGKLCSETPLPYPAHVSAVDLHPEHVPSFGTLEGPLAPNSKLLEAVKLFDGRIHGSESVVIAPDDALVMCDKFGYVWRAPANASGGFDLEQQPVAHLGSGRPLGFHFDADGGLVVAMAGAGLVRADMGSGAVELLASRVSLDDPIAPGSTIDYANDVAVARSGIVYFTDSVHGIAPVMNAAGFWDTMQAYLLTLFHGAPTGRLLSYNPATRATHVVATRLWYANGVALSKDESFAAVVETNTQRVHRVWLSGAKAGQSEVLVERLPGIPDGVSRSGSGGFWIGVVTPELRALKFLHSKYVRFVGAWLPAWARPAIREWGAVVEVSAEGDVLQALYDLEGSHISYVSAVTEAGERLYFGNLAKDYVSYIQKPQAAA